MRSITATMSVTLDGVVQGLGRPDEDIPVAAAALAVKLTIGLGVVVLLLLHHLLH